MKLSDINGTFLQKWDASLEEDGRPTAETLRLFEKIVHLLVDDEMTGIPPMDGRLERLTAHTFNMLGWGKFDVDKGIFEPNKKMLSHFTGNPNPLPWSLMKLTSPDNED